MTNPILFQLERDYLGIVPLFAGYLTTPFGNSHEMFMDLVYDDHNLFVKNNLNTESLASLCELIEGDNRFNQKISKIFKDFHFCTPSSEIYASSTTFVPKADDVINETLNFFLDQGLNIDLLEKVEIEKSVWNKDEKTGEASMVRCIAHSKDDYSILFESIFGELTEKEAKFLLETGNYSSAVPTPIFAFWMSIHYNE